MVAHRLQVPHGEMSPFPIPFKREKTWLFNFLWHDFICCFSSPENKGPDNVFLQNTSERKKTFLYISSCLFHSNRKTRAYAGRLNDLKIYNDSIQTDYLA